MLPALVVRTSVVGPMPIRALILHPVSCSLGDLGSILSVFVVASVGRGFTYLKFFHVFWDETADINFSLNSLFVARYIFSYCHSPSDIRAPRGDCLDRACQLGVREQIYG